MLEKDVQAKKKQALFVATNRAFIMKYLSVKKTELKKR